MFVLPMFIISFKMGKVTPTTKSLGQIKIKSCIHSRSYIFSKIMPKFAQDQRVIYSDRFIYYTTADVK